MQNKQKHSLVLDYLLFGLLGFATAGIQSICTITNTNLISIWFRLDTLYYFLLTAFLYMPFLIISDVFIKKEKNIKKILLNCVVFSYITLGSISCASNFSIALGIVGDFLVVSLFLMCLASWASVKLTEQLEQQEDKK